MSFTLPKLPYAFDALEPYIDAKTMEIHHDGHHEKYVVELNKAVATVPDLETKSVEQLLQSLPSLPESIRSSVRNNGGGHYNHSLFWTIMQKGGSELKHGVLSQAIDKDFGSFDAFKTTFSDKAAKLFGSGWVWLHYDAHGKLIITASPNQDSPIMDGSTPIMGLDVWEHAYYLKYQNKRVSYIDAWWQVINWRMIDERCAMIIRG